MCEVDSANLTVFKDAALNIKLSIVKSKHYKLIFSKLAQIFNFTSESWIMYNSMKLRGSEETSKSLHITIGI